MKVQKAKSYAIPAMADLVRHEWSDEIAQLMQTTPEEIRSNGLDLFAMPLGTVRVELMDKSFVEFRCACSIVSGEKRAIAVFTEHCGYHVFPIHEAKVFHDGKLVYEQKGAEFP